MTSHDKSWDSPFLAGGGVTLTISSFPGKVHAHPVPRIGGLVEDLTKQFSTVARLLLTFTGAAIAFLVVDTSITELDLPGSSWILGFAVASIG